MTPLEQMKQKGKTVWSDFASMENFTGMAAPRLVKFANINANDTVLDVACGTGVVALTAARCGASVTGADLTPELIKRAKENSMTFELDVDFHECDVEYLPFEDASFDVVVSQFGHMFAPRPSVALREMLRVLKPKGTIAFSTWPPELFMGSFFQINGKYGPPLPEGVEPPFLWGNVDIVTKRLSSLADNIVFDRDKLIMPGLSVQHIRNDFETGAGPLKRMVEKLSNEPAKLNALRSEIDSTISYYFEANFLRMDYLMTKAQKI
jgi:SAM-dependent methyltransferase